MAACCGIVVCSVGCCMVVCSVGCGVLVCSVVCSCSVSMICAESDALKLSRASWVAGGGVSCKVMFDSMGGKVSDPVIKALGDGLVTSKEFARGLGECSSCGDTSLFCGVCMRLGVICADSLSLGGTKLRGSVGSGTGLRFLLVTAGMVKQVFE